MPPIETHIKQIRASWLLIRSYFWIYKIFTRIICVIEVITFGVFVYLTSGVSEIPLRNNIVTCNMWLGIPPRVAISRYVMQLKENSKQHIKHYWCTNIKLLCKIYWKTCAGPTATFHDDVIKWKQWRGALVFSLICAWTNGWANNRDAADLRRSRPHDDVTVMWRSGEWMFVVHVTLT